MFRSLIMILATLVHSTTKLPAEEIFLDGEFGDWTDSDPVASEPVGDATSSFDISRVSTRIAGKQVFMRFDTQASLNLQSGAKEDRTVWLIMEFPGTGLCESMH